MMLPFINLIGKYWKVIAAIAWTLIVFGYGYKVRADKCERDIRIAIDMFQAKANQASKTFEDERTKIDTNKRKVKYAKLHNYGDCLIGADRLPIINAALSNDTSKLNDAMP